MIAVDTNVLVRLIAEDDAKQAARARQLFQREQIWVAKTVLLETDWVLRSLYGFATDQIRSALTRLLGMPNVQVEDPLAVADAFSMTDAGIDFADALHVASQGESEGFASFDEKLVKRADRHGISTLLL